MDIEKIWKKSNHAIQARQLISGINDLAEDAKIIVVVRHSHVDFKNLKDLDYRLTPIGHEIARKFGEHLPKDRPIRLFHSSANRCQDTAEKILTGFEKSGGNGEIIGEFNPLYDIGATPDFLLNEIKQYRPFKFFNRWVDGLYPPEKITPIQEYSQNAANLILSELDGAHERGIDIHVSHDLHVLALRSGWFGFPPEKRWISYIGGMAICLNSVFDIDRLVLMENETFNKHLKNH